MKQFLPVLFGAAALIAQPPPGGPGGRGFGGPGFGPPPGPTVTGAPFSATETLQGQETMPDGTPVTLNNQIKLYRDSSGRVRTETTSSTRTIITISDPVAGFVARLDPQNSTAVKSSLPPNPPSGVPPQGAPPDAQSVDLGTKTIAGLVATGKKITHTTPDGTTVTREVWTSTDLKIPVQVITTDPHRGNTTMQMTSATRGEPDASLFQIAPSYTVTTRGRGRGGPQ